MLLKLNKLGKIESQTPASLATCLDFVSLWGSNPDHAKLGRLCAASIGICTDHAKVMPAYNVSTGDPVGYGHKCMERLLNAGVAPGYIYNVGSDLLIEMMKKIPTNEEVEETANFMQAEQDT